MLFPHEWHRSGRPRRPRAEGRSARARKSCSVSRNRWCTPPAGCAARAGRCPGAGRPRGPTSGRMHEGSGAEQRQDEGGQRGHAQARGDQSAHRRTLPGLGAGAARASIWANAASVSRRTLDSAPRPGTARGPDPPRRPPAARPADGPRQDRDEPVPTSGRCSNCPGGSTVVMAKSASPDRTLSRTDCSSPSMICTATRGRCLRKPAITAAAVPRPRTEAWPRPPSPTRRAGTVRVPSCPSGGS